MNYILDEKELQIRHVVPGKRGNADFPSYNAPISAKENILRVTRGEKALFMPGYKQYVTFGPRCVPDVEARANARDGGPNVTHPEGFRDMFGVNWKFIDVAGGSMVEPGKPTLEDMNDWEKVLTFPNVNDWDWDAQRALSEQYIKDNEEVALMGLILNGYFERMISMMDFEGAAMALIDEDQQEAIHAFLDRVADTYIALVDKFLEVVPELTGFLIHDDWGSQRAPFFSLDTAMEMLVPHIKKVADHIHARGKVYDMHCCGKVEKLIPAMIAIGVDSWSGQLMNDKAALYHKYGKDIMIGVESPEIPADMSEEEIAKIAKAYVEEFFDPEAPAMIGYESPVHNTLFFEYVYRYSREKAEN